MNICKKCAMRVADALVNLVVTVATLGFYHKTEHKEVQMPMPRVKRVRRFGRKIVGRGGKRL